MTNVGGVATGEVGASTAGDGMFVGGNESGVGFPKEAAELFTDCT